ncbi:alanine racemase [soil metagenome]|jgi:alanine racemase|nr:alanine racemase [Acidobacteriota bacterium]
MSSLGAERPTWAEIHLDNLAFNFHSVKDFIGQNIKYMAVVKADGYGHGAVECAKNLEKEGIDWFGVALPEEGLELRESGIKKPILCLGSFWTGQEKLLLKYNLTPVIYQLEIAKEFNQAAKEKDLTADIHLKVDTGMGRIGVRFDEVKVFVEGLKQFDNLRVEGIMTHFAAADNLAENDFTQRQIRQFNEAVSIFEENGFRPKYKDLANSPGAIAHKNSRNNLVRLGGVLYGLGDDVLPKGIEKPELRAVMSLHTRISHLKKVPKGETLGYSRTFKTKKDSVIATVPIGYHDGFRRSFSNRGRAIINGVFASVVGMISMDWTILDVTDVPNVKVNDEVILIGEQNKLKITAEELAKLNDTISYEITCGINRRVTRKYVGS